MKQVRPTRRAPGGGSTGQRLDSGQERLGLVLSQRARMMGARCDPTSRSQPSAGRPQGMAWVWAGGGEGGQAGTAAVLSITRTVIVALSLPAETDRKSV